MAVLKKYELETGGKWSVDTQSLKNYTENGIRKLILDIARDNDECPLSSKMMWCYWLKIEISISGPVPCNCEAEIQIQEPAQAQVKTVDTKTRYQESVLLPSGKFDREYCIDITATYGTFENGYDAGHPDEFYDIRQFIFQHILKNNPNSIFGELSAP